jgi:hypothetical protein
MLEPDITFFSIKIEINISVNNFIKLYPQRNFIDVKSKRLLKIFVQNINTI